MRDEDTSAPAASWLTEETAFSYLDVLGMQEQQQPQQQAENGYWDLVPGVPGLDVAAQDVLQALQDSGVGMADVPAELVATFADQGLELGEPQYLVLPSMDGANDVGANLGQPPVLIVMAVANALANGVFQLGDFGEEPGETEGGSRRSRRRHQRASRRLLQRWCTVRPLESMAEDRCVLCLEDMLEGQYVRTLPCSHRLHANCSTRYFTTPGISPICPVCRSAFGRRE